MKRASVVDHYSVAEWLIYTLRSDFLLRTPDPDRNRKLVEASHANAYARAFAFFSYIWFKYNILSLLSCKLGVVVVMILSSQPSAPGFDSRMDCACVIQYAESWKEMHKATFFCFNTLHYS